MKKEIQRYKSNHKYESNKFQLKDDINANEFIEFAKLHRNQRNKKDIQIREFSQSVKKSRKKILYSNRDVEFYDAKTKFIMNEIDSFAKFKM